MELVKKWAKKTGREGGGEERVGRDQLNNFFVKNQICTYFSLESICCS